MSDAPPQVLAGSGSPAWVPTAGVDASPSAPRTVFILQRQLLLRARGALFARLEALGGVPTIADDAAQAALDERATRDMCDALGGVLVDAFGHPALSVAHREYWAGRAPAMLGFGARLHGELARLAPARGDDRRAAQAVALFQLAASLLDWIGDDEGEGAEVAGLIPMHGLPRLVGDPAARDDLLRRARRAGGSARAFATVLVALLERVASLPADTAAFATLLGAAYDAELVSFAPPAMSPAGRVASARRKSELPTLVCGWIAGAARTRDDRATVERAAAAIAPLFGLLDDLADLGDDLRAGQLNTLVPVPPAGGDEDVARAMRDLLAGDAVERHAAEAASCIGRVDAIARDTGVPAASREAVLQWLRTRAWRWLS
jgi:hypothetical protein